MAVKIGSLNKWRKLPIDCVLEFDTQPGNRLRIEFNCEHDTRVEAVHSGEEVTFIAAIKGNETVEFTVPGPVSIVCLSEGEVWYHTGDGKADAFNLTHLRSFRGIMQRQARNPELERILYSIQQGERRREAALAETIAALKAAQEAQNNGQVGSGNTGGNGQQTTEPTEPATPPTAGQGTDTGTTAPPNATGPAGTK